MNERIGIIIDDLVQGATLTVAPAAVNTLPVDYLKTELHAESMQVMGDTATVTIAFTTPQQVNAAVLCWHNLSSAAVVSVDLIDIHENILQSINTPVKPSITAYFAELLIAKVVWHITDVGAEFLQIGRGIVGILWQPEVGVDNGANLGRDDATEQVRSKGGAIHYRVRPRYIKQSVSFAALYTDEALTLYNLQRGKGYFVSVYKDWETVLETKFEGVYAISESINPAHEYSEIFTAAAVFIEA